MRGKMLYHYKALFLEVGFGSRPGIFQDKHFLLYFIRVGILSQ